MARFMLGRRPRAHRPDIPHLSALLAGKALAPLPASVDWTTGLPPDLGAMLNDQIGDCTCAAVGHALQVWSYNANPPMLAEPDADVLALYEGACGYNSADPSTDQGGVEQDVLTYLLNIGIQTPAGVHKIAAFVEVDPRNLDDVKRTIVECGLIYIGFNVPAYMSMTAGAMWDVDPSGDQTIEGGHAVILAGYDAAGFRVISWGTYYTMTPEFFAAFVDEAYAIADPDWVRATGLTPGGLSLTDLEAQMQTLQEAA